MTYRPATGVIGWALSGNSMSANTVARLSGRGNGHAGPTRT
jgi:hypothetical protein